MALSQNTLKKIKISSRIHLFPSKDVNAMLKSILMTTANGKPQTASSRLKFAVNMMLKVPIDIIAPAVNVYAQFRRGISKFNQFLIPRRF